MQKPFAKLIKKLTYLNYHTAKMHYLHQLKSMDSNNHHKPILIYQMGKVGLSTVKKALERYTDRTGR